MKDGCMMPFRKRWTLNDQALFLKRIGVLLGHGYSLVEAIYIMKIQLDSEKIPGKYLEEAIHRLKNGEDFSKILAGLGFHPTAVSFIYYGENNGEMGNSLIRAGEVLERRSNDMKQLQKVSGYPLFLFIFTVIVMTIFHYSLVPQLKLLFSSMEAKISVSMKIMFWIYDHSTLLLLLILSIILFLFISIRRWTKLKSRYEIHVKLCRMPLFGNILRLWNTYYISYQMSQLLKNGHSLTECLQFVEGDPEKKHVQEAFRLIKSELLEGKPLPNAVEKIPIWQREFSTVIRHGELTGNLDIELETYSQLCMDLFTEKISKLLRWIQPALFLIIGLWILLLYISIMLPSFQMIQQF